MCYIEHFTSTIISKFKCNTLKFKQAKQYCKFLRPCEIPNEMFFTHDFILGLKNKDLNLLKGSLLGTYIILAPLETFYSNLNGSSFYFMEIYSWFLESFYGYVCSLMLLMFLVILLLQFLVSSFSSGSHSLEFT